MLRRALLPILVAAAASCTGEPSQPIVVTAESNGGAVRVPQGARFLVRLPSNGTTGYSWVPRQVPEQLKLVADDYEAPAASNPPRAGEGGMQQLTFEARKKGQGVLALDYRPGWSESGEAAETFQVTAEVK